jgi:hypothetical protein
MRTTARLIGVAALGVLCACGASALAASSKPAGGSVAFFATPTNGAGSAGTILFTGAIGDHGSFVNISQAGKPDATGNYVRISLIQGGFEFNDTQLDAKAAKVVPNTNATTCSGALTVTAPVQFLDGTGLYKGIAGSVSVTEFYGYLLPRLANGKCNNAAAGEVSLNRYLAVIGGGNVTFG